MLDSIALKALVNVSLFIFFFVLFAYLVHGSYLKYQQKDTILSSRLEDRYKEKIAFPSISICPGFRNINGLLEESDHLLEWTPSIFNDLGSDQ